MTSATKPREPRTVLLTVTHDRALSTPWHEHYLARSDSRPGLFLDVWHDVEAGTWTCDDLQCPGYKHHRRCHHIDRAKRLRRVQWWHAYFLGWGPHDLRAQRDSLLGRDAELGLTEDERCAVDALDSLLEIDTATAA